MGEGEGEGEGEGPLGSKRIIFTWLDWIVINSIRVDY